MPNKLPLLTANSNGVSPILSAIFTFASYRINRVAISTLPVYINEYRSKFNARKDESLHKF